MKSRIAWLVPYPIKGSGGHRTIFSHINNLVGRGHECHVFIGEEQGRSAEEKSVREVLEDFFGECPAHIHYGYKVEETFDAAVATAWWTAEIVALRVKARHKLYFVQDYEPWFNPMGDAYIKAERSYRFGLIPLTIGRWLSQLLSKRYNCDTNFFDFSADLNVYYPINEIDKEKAVCFIYQPEKPRRCPAIGRETLARVKHHCPDVKIYTYGSDAYPDFDFEHTHLGILSLEECNLLYNKCSAGLCLSSSNPSRVPFEMMAAGLPPVDFYGENTIYDLPEGGAILAERDPSSLAGAIIKILDSPDLQRNMKRYGVQHMKNKHVALEYGQSAQIIERILTGEQDLKQKILPLYDSGPFHAELEMPFEMDGTRKEEEKGIHVEAPNFFTRLSNNRLGRVMKVLWRGYY